MGAWGYGMSANDTAGDYTDCYYDYDKEGLTKEGLDVIDGRVSIFSALMDARKQLSSGWKQDNDWGLLGVANFFMRRGVVLKGRARQMVLAAVKRELSPRSLITWNQPWDRRKALLRFKKRIG